MEPPGSEQIDNLDIAIADGDLGFLDNYPAYKWAVKRALYEYLTTNPALISEYVSFLPFVNTEATSSIGKFTEISNEIQNAYDIDASLSADLEQYHPDFAALLENLKQTDSLLLENMNNASEFENLTTTKTNLLNQLVNLQATYAITQDAVNTAITTALQNASTLNDNVVATEEYEINEKTVNEIRLSKLSGNALTTAQIDMLKAIAILCPYDDGNSVYVARGLLPVEELWEITDNYACPLPPSGEMPVVEFEICLLYTSPSPRDREKSRMPSSA